MKRASLVFVAAGVLWGATCAPRGQGRMPAASTEDGGSRSMQLESPSHGPATASPLVVFTHATIIDGTGRPGRPDMTVVVRDGRIAEVYPSGSRPVPDEAEQHDLTGKYLMPGLVDAHVHLGTRERPPGTNEVLLRHAFLDGVTTVRDMGGSFAVVGPLARASRSDTVAMPRIYFSAVVAGPAEARWFDGASGAFMAGGAAPGTSPLVRRVRPGDDVSALIREAKAAGATGIKLYDDIEPALIRELVSEAHRQGLRTWSHLAVSPGRPRDVVGAGVQVVTHGDQFRADMLGPMPEGLSDSLRRIARLAQYAQMSPDDTAMTRVLEQMRQRGTMFDPTLFVMLPLEPPSDQSKANMDRVLLPFRFAAGMTRRAVRMGIPIVAGTDALGGSTANLHAELQLLVDSAGLTPLEAIRAATLHGAMALGMQDSLGTIAVGRRADLVVLRADPTADIRNTQTVEAVVKGGRLFARTSPRRPGPLASPPPDHRPASPPSATRPSAATRR